MLRNERVIIWRDDRNEISRRSKDKAINIESKKFLEKIEERGWDILNGNAARDEEELTHRSKR